MHEQEYICIYPQSIKTCPFLRHEQECICIYPQSIKTCPFLLEELVHENACMPLD